MVDTANDNITRTSTSLFTPDFIFKAFVGILLIGSFALGAKAYFSATSTEIVMVRVSDISTEFINAHARSSEDGKINPNIGIEFTKALKSETDQLGEQGMIVLVGEAVIAGEVRDMTKTVRDRVFKKVPLPRSTLRNFEK